MLAHPVPLTQLRSALADCCRSAYGVALILGYSALAMRWQPTYVQRWTCVGNGRTRHSARHPLVGLKAQSPSW